jgi:hypothetical protein
MSKVYKYQKLRRNNSNKKSTSESSNSVLGRDDLLLEAAANNGLVEARIYSLLGQEIAHVTDVKIPIDGTFWQYISNSGIYVIHYFDQQHNLLKTEKKYLWKN